MIEEKFPNISQALLDDLKLCGEACRGMYAFCDIAVVMKAKHLFFQSLSKILSRTTMNYVLAYKS